jgi:alpha-galactosidase
MNGRFLVIGQLGNTMFIGTPADAMKFRGRSSFVIKVAMIGAGSVVFSKNLTGDILSYPEFRNATFSYMDIDPERLEVAAALCRRVARTLGAKPTIETTQDLSQALSGADFVINMVQIGGFNSTLVDFEIPRKYGLNFTIADTTGPGGFFRALRTFPMLRDLCESMSRLCPGAVLLNYSNPMGMNMQTITRTSQVRAVGLCHSVQGTLDEIMGYIGVDAKQVTFTCAGINHMAFYTRLEKDGIDLYPRLFEAMNTPAVYNSNKVRFELMKRLGYFVTESSEHNAEYSPYFIPHGREFSAKYNVPIDEYLRRCDCIVDKFAALKASCRDDEPLHFNRSHEYGSTIIHSLVTGTPTVIYGNAANRGAVSNLPDSAITEVATRVDHGGLTRSIVGELPPQLIGYMQPHVTQQELFIRAALEGRRDHVYQAAMFDPLTAATLTLDQIVEMCDELIAAHGSLLPPLDAKRTLIAGSGKSFAPVDPRDLRASWDAAQARAAEDFLIDWYVLGPFKGPDAGKISLDVVTPLDELAHWAGSALQTVSLDPEETARGAVAAPTIGSGEVDVKRTVGRTPWKSATANRKNGFVDLSRALGHEEFCIGYAYAEIISPQARDTVLRCGSDDGIRIWLNGAIIHNHEIGRGYKPCSDEVPIRLIAGTNRLLVKIDNYHGGWGFGLMIPRK